MVEDARATRTAGGAPVRLGGTGRDRDVVGVAVDAARIERQHDGGTQLRHDRLQAPDDLLRVGVGEAVGRARPVLHPAVAVAEEDRLPDAEREHRLAKLAVAQLPVKLARAGLPTQVPVGRTDQVRRHAAPRRERQDAAHPEGLVVRVGEDREQAARRHGRLVRHPCEARGRVPAGVIDPPGGRAPRRTLRAARPAPPCAGRPPRRPRRGRFGGGLIRARGAQRRSCRPGR